MRVLFIGDGESVHVIRWLEAMRERGVEVHLVTDRPGKMNDVYQYVLPRASSILFRVLQGFKVRKIAREIKPDIVHAHYVTSYGLWGAMIKKLCPYVITAWGSDILLTPGKNILYRWLTSRVLDRADLVTADADEVIRKVRLLAPLTNAINIQWGVDLRQFPERESDFGDSNVQLISLRAWEPLYHILDIVEAFALVVKKNPGIRLHLLGGGSLESDINTKLEKLELLDSVTCHGRVAEEKVTELLYIADISISVPELDGSAMSLLESMASGAALVVSDIPANREWLDENSAEFVPVGEKAQLAAKLESLVVSSDRRKALTKRARQMVVEKANRDIEMNRMYEQYVNLAGDY